MADEALHTEHHDAFPGTPYPSPLHLFAGVLLVRGWGPAEARIAALVARARAEASQTVASGRAPAAAQDVLAFKLLYAHAREAAGRLRPRKVAGATRRWEVAFAGLGALRHRQRASLALYYAAGLSMADVAVVLGVREAEARKIVEAAVAGLLRTVDQPLDVRRALRIAGEHLIARPPRASRRLQLAPPVPGDVEPRETPPLPREVVRALLAPVPSPPAEPPAEAASDAPERHGAAGRWPRRGLRRRLLVAGAAAVVVFAVLLPVAARSGGEAADGPAAAPAVEAAPESVIQAPVAALAPDRVRVRRGDTLWALAGRWLDDPLRWREIWRLNRRAPMPGGRTFTDPHLIHPGWTLRLPAR